MTAEWLPRRIALGRGQRGFTLIELVTVMIVIGVLAVVALPNFSLLGGYDEVGYRDQVKATLEFARKAAVAQRRYSCVSRSGNTLAVTIDISSPEGRGVATCPREQNLMLPGGSGNTISPRGNVSLLGTSTAAVVFDAQGRPWTAASATLSTAAQFTVHGGSDTVVTVEAETGYVH
ncbi:MAG: prepilin-type N-terminal cleavage/methylation domain-containing protein [Sterolibacterium sp.]|jgi:MSHA pilin protein MshC